MNKTYSVFLLENTTLIDSNQLLDEAHSFAYCCKQQNFSHCHKKKKLTKNISTHSVLLVFFLPEVNRRRRTGESPRIGHGATRILSLVRTWKGEARDGVPLLCCLRYPDDGTAAPPVCCFCLPWPFAYHGVDSVCF
jgi:hypothetical protein